MKARKAFISEEYFENRLSETTEIMKNNLRFKNPNLINAENLCGGYNRDTWVLAMFLKPGKQDFVIRSA